MRVSSGPSAAQGSSMIRMRALKYSAREMATTWRWPPDSERTGSRMLRKFGLSCANTWRAAASIA